MTSSIKCTVKRSTGYKFDLDVLGALPLSYIPVVYNGDGRI
jgi:hypothetical protein